MFLYRLINFCLKQIILTEYYSIIEDFQEADVMEVLEVDGLHIFKNFSLKKAEMPFIFEE